MLRFLLQSPNGYHVGLCSRTPFTFGDEDLVMSCLQKVRLPMSRCEGYRSNMSEIFKRIKKRVEFFNDLRGVLKSEEELSKTLKNTFSFAFTW